MRALAAEKKGIFAPSLGHYYSEIGTVMSLKKLYRLPKTRVRHTQQVISQSQ